MVLAMFAMLRPITMSPPGGQAGIGTYSRGCTYGIGEKNGGPRPARDLYLLKYYYCTTYIMERDCYIQVAN